MPIKTTCPECDKAYTLADTMEGKSVKCKSCGQPFTVQAAANGIAAKPSNGKVVKAAAKKRVADDDDEVPVKKGGLGKWLLIGGGLVAVLMLFVCGGVGLGGYLIYRSYNSSDDSSPTASTTSETDKDKDKTKDTNPVQPPPTAGKITLDSYNKIKGGMTVADAEGILGKPFTKQDLPNKTLVSVWTSGLDSVNITYENGKAKSWSGSIDGKLLGPNMWTDPSTNPKPTTQLTLENFNKIQGGENPTQMIGIFGIPTKQGQKPDSATAQNVSDRGSTWVWSSGADSVTVNFTPDIKAASWSAVIGGMSYTGNNPAYFVKPTTTATLITKDNFDKIKGGETEEQMKALLGKVTNANTGVTDGQTAKYDKIRVDTWADGGNSITVTFCAGKVARWTGLIDSKKLEQTNQQFVILKGTSPVNLANYNMVIQGQTTEQQAILAFGPQFTKSNVSEVKQGKVVVAVRYHLKWTDGQGGEMTLFFINNGMVSVVEKKESNNRLK